MDVLENYIVAADEEAVGGGVVVGVGIVDHRVDGAVDAVGRGLGHAFGGA